jgi:hypothetical protein
MPLAGDSDSDSDFEVVDALPTRKRRAMTVAKLKSDSSEDDSEFEL